MAGGFYYAMSCPNDICPLEPTFASVGGLLDVPPGFKRLRLVYLIGQIIFTVGYGDMTPQTTSERLFMIALTLVGQTLFACTVANTSSLVYNLDIVNTR